MDSNREYVTLDDLEEQESLAGRTAILHMSSLSQHEIYGNGENIPFSIDPENLKLRKTTHGKGCTISMRPELSAIDNDNYIVPVWMI